MRTSEITEAGITELLRQNHQDASIPEYLRTMACVHFETGRRVMPRYIDDEVFRFAAAELERLEASVWELGAKVLSLEAALSAALSAQAAETFTRKQVQDAVRKGKDDLMFAMQMVSGEPEAWKTQRYERGMWVETNLHLSEPTAADELVVIPLYARPPCDSRTETQDPVADGWICEDEFTLEREQYDVWVGEGLEPTPFYFAARPSPPSSETLEDRRMALEAAWQPIETAPKDGTEVLITTAGYGMLVRIGFFDAARGDVWSIWPGGDRMNPTHWRPLPAPPRALTQKDNGHE